MLSLSCSLSLLRSNSRFVFAVAGSTVVVVIAAVFVSCTFVVVAAADVRLPTVWKKKQQNGVYRVEIKKNLKVERVLLHISIN